MDKLDDLSICKLIAEIEGVQTYPLGNNYLLIKSITFGTAACVANEYAQCKTTEEYLAFQNKNKEYLYDPLTDDALCFKLMVEHEIEFWSLTACDVKEYHARKLGGNKNVNFHSANRAICLAIIEAHNE